MQGRIFRIRAAFSSFTCLHREKKGQMVFFRDKIEQFLGNLVRHLQSRFPDHSLMHSFYTLLDAPGYPERADELHEFLKQAPRGAGCGPLQQDWHPA